ncbi:hypothetical protein CONPUDRAFT_154858 [Coniophora puteana RWD-64-598 SS2]|uniref:Uncharacterized protein n=1 Tax=Coniophora puteana (strain RWD-64-598) TaxID=741705 RepID=A0A5M3MJM1_CONPW|nr:uncharacterized protein CONPUDRAFT_154858 [Coniophora puteana RWD-64-598 SS2]EIW79438.1 hypothetical protein CONPUDRAFT_154858 [Coniophora puteana RWD-64-598 SS2]
MSRLSSVSTCNMCEGPTNICTAPSLELNNISNHDDLMHILYGWSRVELSIQFSDGFYDVFVERALQDDSVTTFGGELKYLMIVPCLASPNMLRRLLEKEDVYLTDLSVGPLTHPMNSDEEEVMKEVAESFMWC